MTLAVALLAASLGIGSAPAATPALEEVYREGVKAYDAQDYDRAVERFGELLRYRVDHPAVEYNLGNAYFKKQDYGRAVLHWERAARLDPGDPETRANLALVRTLLVDEVPAKTTPIGEAVERAKRAFDLDESAVIAFVAWEVLGLAVLIAILRPGPLRGMGVGLAILAALVLAVSAPLFLLQLRDREDTSRFVVIGATVEARSGPGSQYTTVFTVHEGLVVRERGEASGWEWVELPNGLNGWLPADEVERI